MKVEILFIYLITALSPVAIFSQTEPKSKDFIIFKNGKKLNGNKVIKKGRILFLDEMAYELNTVMFYHNNKGNFAKTPLGFQKRTIDGKVSVYSNSSVVNPNKNLNPLNSWYTMDESFVKRTSYSNLRVNLKDNVSSMQYLNTYRNLNILGLGLTGAGLGIFTYSMNQYSWTSSEINISNTIYVSLATCLSGVIILGIAPRKMAKAIQAYNNSSKLKL